MSKKKSNLLSKSVNQHDYSIATKEWAYTGECYDILKATDKCQLCNTDIRYLFVIKNYLNGEKLFIGSDCVIKYLIPVIENKTVFVGENAKKILYKHKKSLQEENRNRIAILNLEKISVKSKFYNDLYLFYFKKNYFTLKQMLCLIKLDIDFKYLNLYMNEEQIEQYNSLPEYYRNKLKRCRFIKK